MKRHDRSLLNPVCRIFGHDGLFYFDSKRRFVRTI